MIGKEKPSLIWPIELSLLVLTIKRAQVRVRAQTIDCIDSVSVTESMQSMHRLRMLKYNAAPPLFHSVLSPGHSSEGGPVVDLTYDSGVEDEELVDLTSPVRVRS